MSEHFETPPEQVDDFDFERRMTDVARTVVAKLVAARKDYGESWVKRGGTGAYMVAMRKFDRLEQALPAHGYDIFAALRADQRAEGVADDMQDLVAYLLLWIEYADRLGLWPKPIQRGTTSSAKLITAPEGTPVISSFQPRPRTGDDPHDAEESTHG